MTTYTVMNGDTMWSIATKNKISLNDLIKANPQVSNPGFILPGQTINIPTNNKTTYTIMPGDTMWSIATKNKINLNDLIKANPQVSNPTLILSGQTINIPTTTSTPSQDNIPSTTNVPSDIKSLEAEVIRLVNIERTKAGIPALTSNDKISNVARIKSNDFIESNYFSHNSPTYGTPFEMLKSFGITFTAAAENIASGQGTAAQVMNSWMNSSGHRTNILNSTYNQIGVGVAKDSKGNMYWTQLFIKN